MSELAQWAADLKAHFESVESTAKAFLERHVPGVVAVAEKLDSDPLVQVALSTVLPPEAKAMVAQWIKDLEDRFPAPPPEPAPEQAPADVQDPPTG